MTTRKLILENGEVFEGTAFGSENGSDGEVVFTTGMTGYQETMTDPSFCGQIVTMTYPLIGNYGMNRDDFETIAPAIKGFVVQELAKHHQTSVQSVQLMNFVNKKISLELKGLIRVN